MPLPDISEYYHGDLAKQTQSDWLEAKLYLDNLEHVTAAIDRFKAKRVLEVGCGSGLMTNHLPPDVEYLGVDNNPTFLGYAEANCQNPNCQFVQMDVRKLTPAWVEKNFGPIDLVTSWAFFKHFGLHEHDAVLEHVLSFAPAACLEMTVADEAFDDGTDFHHTFTTDVDIARVLKRAGRRLVSEKTTFDGPTAEDRPVKVKVIVAATPRSGAGDRSPGAPAGDTATPTGA